MRFKRQKNTGYEIERPQLGVPTVKLGVAVPKAWIPELDRLIRVSQDLNPDNPYRSRSDLVRRVLADTLELDCEFEVIGKEMQQFIRRQYNLEQEGA